MITHIKKFDSMKTNSHWFEKHSKCEFTRYTKVFAKLSWSYWMVAKYGHLTDLGRTKEARDLIEEYRDEIFNKMNSAVSEINEWNNAPKDLRVLLLAIYKSTEIFLSDSIEIFDRINFHNNFGVKIEQPLNDLLETLGREQYVMRMYSQHTDEADLNSMYYRWANVYYEAIKYLNSVTDINSWASFRRFCLENVLEILPKRKQIEASAAATFQHLEIKDDLKTSLAQKYKNLWLELFVSSAQFNHSLLFLIRSKEFPSEDDLKKFNSLVDEASTKQVETSITLLNIFINDQIYIN